MLSYGRHDINEWDIHQVAEVLRSDAITRGPVSEEFERVFADYVGADYAVVFCNATAALHCAMLAAGIGNGDRVITSPNTFVASANCAAYVGATPDFVDVSPIDNNICAEALMESWTDDVKAIVPVHYAGASVDMARVGALARERGAVVIEDACHALGGSIWDSGELKKIGGHDYADMTVFSFHPVKTMTSGEGGMLVTNNRRFADKARAMRTHGIVRSSGEWVGLGLGDYKEQGPWYYEMQSLGYNLNITDFQCALGLSQLARLEQKVERRLEIVERYNSAFEDIPEINTPLLRDSTLKPYTSWHLYSAHFDFASLGMTRTELMERLRCMGIGTQVLYIPVYLQPWYRKTFGYSEGKCPVAEQHYQTTLSLPLFSAMTDSDVQYVIDCVSELCQQDCRSAA